MPRVRLQLPDDFSFSTELTVRIGEINYGQHLGNDALLTLVQEARLRFLAEYGFSEMNAGGAGLIMADAVVVYRSQARHGDQLRVDVAVTDVTRTGFDMVYRIVQAGDDREVARAKTGLVFFDYESERVTGVPDVFKKRVPVAKGV